MAERLQKKAPFIAAALVIALLSWLVVSGFVSSTDFHKDTLAELEEKQTTVLELSATSLAASTAITMIPGETATPIADKLADLSSHFLVALCAIFLEKYLLTITGTVTFSILIPSSCILYILNVIFDWKNLRQLAAKLAAFGLLIFLVIPSSVWLSNMIEDTYQASIEETIEAAKETTDEIESSASAEDEKEEGFLSGIMSAVTDGVSNMISGVTEKAGELVNHFIEALAVMLVTCCVIPVLVLLSFIWFAKILLAVDLPVSYRGIHSGIKDAFFRKKQEDPQDI